VTVDVKLRVAPTVPAVGPPMLAVRGCGEMLTIWDAVADAPLWSVTVSDTVYVPLTAYVVENVDAVPLAGLPPVAVHAYVYGEVPPETVEVKLSNAFTLPEVGPLIDAVRGVAGMLMRWNAEAVLPFWSVTVSVTLYVPFTAKLVEKVAAVPVDGLPPETAHAYV
jgi:hypothetical protein